MSSSFSAIRSETSRVLRRAVCSVVGRGYRLGAAALAQQPDRTGRQDQPEVFRVTTELVQTDVMVFDGSGRFVNDLSREQFELKINGKVKTVDFFERITAGSLNEEQQLAAARGSARTRSDTGTNGAVPLDRGRPVFFYVDDLHLDPSSLNRTRKLITRFVDQEMGQNDETVVTSASGQIGFLQQLTDNKTVLRAAIAKLSYRNYNVKDTERPAMTEFQALKVDGYDRNVTDYFVEETMKANPGTTRDNALIIVQGRARALLQQAARVTTNSLAGLEGLVKSARSIPGRKLVFFISDGFLLDSRNSDAQNRLQRITSIAAKSGVVIYSIDARGLSAGLGGDASDPGPIDPTGRLQSSMMGELSATQDPLNALAHDTGGKAFFNSNALEPAVKRALQETSTYYLLAWKPDSEAKESKKFNRIEVKVIGRPGLTLQVRRGYFNTDPELVVNTAKRTEKSGVPAVNAPQLELGKVMRKTFPEREIPVSLSLSYLNLADKGSILSATMQVPREFFFFEPVNGKPTAVVDIAGNFFDAQGRPGARFGNRITVNPPPNGGKEHDILYSHPVYLTPGLYHVRVAARDEKSGKSGSAHGWIEIPDLSKGQLTLSSALLGRRPAGDPATVGDGEELQNSVGVSVNHRFTSGDFLRFLIFAYNAARASTDAKPDIALQVQILRDEQPVVTTPLKRITVDPSTDLARIPYAADVSLAGLPAGRYLLRLTAVDRVTKTTASQQARFDIE